MSISLVIADFISLTLVIYVLTRLNENRALTKSVRQIFWKIGAVLILALVMDQVWEQVYENSQQTKEAAFLLNALACLEFFCIPITFFLLIGFHREKRDAGDRAAAACTAGLGALYLLNMRFPIVFIHNEKLEMENTPLTGPIYLFSLALLSCILVHDFLMSFDVDRENRTLILFVIIIAGLGYLDCWALYDVVAVWECLSIVYLFLYLAVARLYDKTDPVTELPNRNAFQSAFDRTENRKIVLASFDLNHLKNFNDENGHQTGDAYLLAFAGTMQKLLSSCGKLYRTGGDEFVLLSFGSEETLRHTILDARSRGMCLPEYGSYPLDFAFGIATRRPGESNRELFARADAAMYEDKKQVEGSSVRNISS